MNVLIVLAHPDQNSFNHAIADTCLRKLSDNGYDIIFHDLYQEKFDPLLGKNEIPKDGQVDEMINVYCDELANCDGIIIVHPNWWGQPPAVLKGWIDRVFRPGLAYEFEDGDLGEGIPVGLLRAESALVFNTSNTSVHRENTVFKDPLELLWKNCIFDLCGVSELVDKHFPGNDNITD
jgi:putative NADPH-quinone reductase